MFQLLSENSLTVPQKRKVEINTWPSNSTPKYKHLRELKTGIQRDTHTKISTTALFTKVESCKQPKCPPRDEWINRCDTCCTGPKVHKPKQTSWPTQYFSVLSPLPHCLDYWNFIISFEVGSVSPPTLSSFSATLDILGLVPLDIHFRFSFSIFTK